MTDFNTIDPKEINENLINLIGKNYALITVSDDKKINMMTASWGFFGVMWNKNVVNLVVRPSRYTYEFLSKNPKFTLNFLPEDFKTVYSICGTKSGRDCDKVNETGLSPVKIDKYLTSFKESEYTFVCKTLYKQEMDKTSFVDENFGSKMYPEDDIHTMFIAEIEKVYKKIH